MNKTTTERIIEIMVDVATYYEPIFTGTAKTLEEKLKNQLEALVLQAKLEQLQSK